MPRVQRSVERFSASRESPVNSQGEGEAFRLRFTTASKFAGEDGLISYINPSRLPHRAASLMDLSPPPPFSDEKIKQTDSPSLSLLVGAAEPSRRMCRTEGVLVNTPTLHD